MKTSWWAGLLVALLPAPLAAQSLAQRVQGAGDGTVRLSFAARQGVCSRGPGSITIIDDDEDDEEWEGDCERGPVRVSLRMQGGRVAESETYVGGRWRAGRGRVTDVGLVPAQEAADLLLALAPQVGDDDGGELVTAATLADSVVVWPQLLRMARDPKVREETRRQAVFWLSQAAGDEATKGLDSIATDRGGEIEDPQAGGVRPLAAPGRRGGAGPDPHRANQPAPRASEDGALLARAERGSEGADAVRGDPAVAGHAGMAPFAARDRVRSLAR